jgi:hypothetical protein
MLHSPVMELHHGRVGLRTRMGRASRQGRREMLRRLRVFAICDSKTESPLGPHGPARRAITPQPPMEVGWECHISPPLKIYRF